MLKNDVYFFGRLKRLRTAPNLGRLTVRTTLLQRDVSKHVVRAQINSR